MAEAKDKSGAKEQPSTQTPDPKPGTSGAEKSDSQDKQKDKPDSGQNEDG